MKTLILIGLLVASIQLSYAQINAITESGDEVLLHEDGTWQYVNDSITSNAPITVNETAFIKEKQSTFLVKSTKVNIGIWINPKSWSFSKGTDNEAHEFRFKKKDNDLYAMLIAEKMQIPLETLKDIAFKNAKKVAPDVKVIKDEYRTVNGIQVLMMQMSGTIQGVKFTYFGYYYSNANGTVQLLTYTGESLFNSSFNDLESFLNGFVEL